MRAVGEVAKHRFALSADRDRAFRREGKVVHGVFLFRGARRLRGLGPRRVSSSSAASFSFQRASLHMRSSTAATGASALRRTL